MELLQDKEFAPYVFKLDWQHAILLTPKVADIIGLRYERLSLHTKTKFHTNLLKMEIVRLKMLTLQECQHINKTEQELKYIQSLKVAQTTEATIFKAV